MEKLINTRQRLEKELVKIAKKKAPQLQFVAFSYSSNEQIQKADRLKLKFEKIDSKDETVVNVIEAVLLVLEYIYWTAFQDNFTKNEDDSIRDALETELEPTRKRKVALTDKQKKLYEELHDYYRGSQLSRNKISSVARAEYLILACYEDFLFSPETAKNLEVIMEAFEPVPVTTILHINAEGNKGVSTKEFTVNAAKYDFMTTKQKMEIVEATRRYCILFAEDVLDYLNKILSK